MMRLRRASVIATLSLLVWAATANAECAWVLWAQWSIANGTSSFASGLIPISGFTTKRECDQERARRPQQETENGTLFCLPDTVDPRGPKGR